MTNKERYATIGTWYEVLKREGADVSLVTVARKLRGAGVIGETARNRKGRLVRKGFYPESEVRKLLSDLLQDLLQADKNGFIEKDGQIYGSAFALAKLLGLSGSSIQSRIQNPSLKSIQGKDVGGHICTYYLVSQVQALCDELLQDLPQADENGFIEVDGQTYCNILGFSRLTNIGQLAVKTRIQKEQLSPLRGKNRGGIVCDFYSLAAVQILCQDLTQDLPRADENGFIEVNGQMYGTFVSLSRLLGHSPKSTRSKIWEANLEPTKGKDSLGHVRDFYPLNDVKMLCGEPPKKRGVRRERDKPAINKEVYPQADENGLLDKDGIKYAILQDLVQLLGISKSTIKLRIQSGNVEAIKGRRAKGRVATFYPVEEVRRLFEEGPSFANADGLIEKGGQTYGTIESLSRALSLSACAIQSRIQDNPPSSIQGCDSMSKLRDFYPLTEVRKLCEDLLQELPQANEDGFVELHGEVFATRKSISDLLGVSPPTIIRRINDSSLEPIQAKDRLGRVFDYYSVSQVRGLFQDLLQDVPQVNEAGVLEQAGEIFVSCEYLSSLVGLSSSTVRLRILDARLSFVKARGRSGKVLDLFALSEAKLLFDDSRVGVPMANENGFIEVDGIVFGTIAALANEFGLSPPTVKSRLSKSTLKPIAGKDVHGVLRDYYSLDHVRECCGDLLQRVPEANDDGLVEFEGQVYAPLQLIAQQLGIGQSTIKMRINKSSLKGLQGKDRSRHLIDFYCISDIRELCRDLLQDVPVADERGMLQIDGLSYANVRRLSILFEASDHKVKTRLQRGNCESVHGKNVNGRVYDYYSVPEARRLCADLIAKKSKK